MGGQLAHPNHGTKRTVAYFSMEIGIEPSIPTYSGGLGVLAGDTVRAAADAGVGMVSVSLLYRHGYFTQSLTPQGSQIESDITWSHDQLLVPEKPEVSIRIDVRNVLIQAWRFEAKGQNGHIVPVYFLDTDIEGNPPDIRALSERLYGGDPEYRLRQEALLGLGGVAMLDALGFKDIHTYHLNEGHSALLAVALLQQKLGDKSIENATDEDVEAVRRRCVFTTHTPVPAGQDKFDAGLASAVLGSELWKGLQRLGATIGGALNMTNLGLFFSRYVNGVSMRNEEVSRGIFPGYPINSITNGVHAVTWTAAPFQKLFDKHIPQWRRDNLYLRYAIDIPLDDIREAHLEAKRDLMRWVEGTTGIRLDDGVFTLGLARRATPYKRLDMLLSNPERLRKIANDVGPFQIVFAGKAHPRDQGGKEQIRKIFQHAAELEGTVRVVYLADYDMRLARLVCSGCDIWVNTPHKPLEASGTSGMKAALNGVPSISVLDGWWIEGWIEHATGWAIGDATPVSDPAAELESLYDQLEFSIMPMFYDRPSAYFQMGKTCIAVNGSFFNAQRMLSQYRTYAYEAVEQEPNAG